MSNAMLLGALWDDCAVELREDLATLASAEVPARRFVGAPSQRCPGARLRADGGERACAVLAD